MCQLAQPLPRLSLVFGLRRWHGACSMLAMARIFSAVLVASVGLWAVACGGSTSETGDGSGGDAGSGASAGAGGTSTGSGGSGATGTGGTSGGGGSGTGGTGTGGSGAGGSGTGGGSNGCVAGGSCDTEGANCVENGCCPCSNVCQNGQWQPSVCPGCAPPECPMQVPTAGEACDPCDIPGDACRYDECGGAGRLSASCSNGMWRLEAEPCVDPPACCSDDVQCPGMRSICISTICKSPSDSGSCWRDGECGGSMKCSGAFVCPCNADCATADQQGLCVPDDPACCSTDRDCTMAAPSCVNGACKAPPVTGECWRDTDCAGGRCDGASVCQCLSACLVPDSPGKCVPR